MIVRTQERAFALFGSAARGDYDSFSDRDMLIVSDDEATLRRLKSEYDSVGWSCTAYSWSRLQRASDQGSLFVQHLKQESKILSDPSNRLAHLLDLYSPRASYKPEWDGTASLLGNLTQHMPQCAKGPMWTVDVLTVAFRSLAVTSLADNGIYAFSNDDIIGGLNRIGMASNQDGHQLSALRQFKSLYRRGVTDERITWFVIFNWIRILDRMFALGLSPRQVGTVEMVELALNNSANAKMDSNWYVRCRRIESALWMLKVRDKRDRADFQKQRQSLFGIVTSPNTYAWHFTTGYASIQDKLSDLAEMCAV